MINGQFRMNKKGFSSLVIIAIIGIVLLISGAYYFIKADDQNAPEQNPKKFNPAQNLLTNSASYSGNGFTINLPKDWHLTSSLSFAGNGETTETFTPFSDDEVQKALDENPYNPNFYLEIIVKDNPKKIDLKTWATNSKYSPQGLGQKVSEVEINNQKGVLVEGNQGKGFVDYYLENDGKIYNLSYYYNDNDSEWKTPSKIKLSDLKSIVSSFKFSPKQTVIKEESKELISVIKNFFPDGKVQGNPSKITFKKQVGDMARYQAIATAQQLDPLTIILEKQNGEWKVKTFGTSFPDLEAQNPELFKD